MMLQQPLPLPLPQPLPQLQLQQQPIFLHQSHHPAAITTATPAPAPAPASAATDTPKSQPQPQPNRPVNNNSNNNEPQLVKNTTSTTADASIYPSPGVTIRKATAADAPAIAQLASSVFTASFGFSIPTNDLKTYLDNVYTLSAIEADINSPTKHIFVATPTTPLPSSSPTCDDSDDPAAPPPAILGFVQLTENNATQTTAAVACLDDLDDLDLDMDTASPCSPSASTGRPPSRGRDRNRNRNPGQGLLRLVELQRLYVRRDWHRRGVGKALASHVESLARHTLGYSHIWLGVWEGNFIAQRVYEALGYQRVGEREFNKGRCVHIDWIMVKSLR